MHRFIQIMIWQEVPDTIAREYKAAQIKTAGAMNLMMSGNVFLYYGEEIGMKGSGKDENKRAPMQWSSDASAEVCVKGRMEWKALR